MRGSKLLQRAFITVVAAAACAVAGAGVASAQPVVDGSIKFSGDPGDYITGGRSYEYSRAKGDGLTVSAGADRRHLSLSVNAASGTWWTLDLAAPLDEVLTAKTYDNAHRYPFNGAGPGLNLSGDGRGCNQLTGTFTIQAITWGPHGYVQKLDATYEQHCENGSSALRGEVHINNPAPPAELKLEAAVAEDGRFNPINGNAHVHGTISCTADASVYLNGTVTQVKNQVIIRGNYSATVPCKAGTAAKWAATAVPSGTTPFQRGKAEVYARASAQDQNYPGQAISEKTAVITLTRGTSTAVAGEIE